MIDCLRTRVRKQSVIALYFEFENELKFYKLEAWFGYIRNVILTRILSLVFIDYTTMHFNVELR